MFDDVGMVARMKGVSVGEHGTTLAGPGWMPVRGCNAPRRGGPLVPDVQVWCTCHQNAPGEGSSWDPRPLFDWHIG